MKVGAPAGIDASVPAPEVGKGRGVLDGGRVGASVFVAGIGVALGSAPCVSATIVSAAASAVCPISTGFAVGVPRGAQALTSKMNTTPISKISRFMS